MKERSLASLKREEKRNSPEIQKFKTEIDTFLSDKPPFIQYTIKRDLAVMTNMPYYKDRPKRVKIDLSRKELLIEWVKVFLAHDNFEFITRKYR